MMIFKTTSICFLSIVVIGCSKGHIEKKQNGSMAASCDIGFEKQFKYLNTVPCIKLPYKSNENFDLIDLSQQGVIDQENFFGMNYTEEGELKSSAMAKFRYDENTMIFIVASNVGMEGEGYAQTFNLFPVNIRTGKKLNNNLYYLGYTKYSYNFDIDEYFNDKKIDFNLKNLTNLKKEEGYCHKWFTIKEDFTIYANRFCSKKEKIYNQKSYDYMMVLKDAVIEFQDK